MKSMIAIVLLATVGLAQCAPQPEFNSDQCIKQAESFFAPIEVGAEVEQLLDVIRAAHPGKALMEVDEVGDEVKAKLKAMDYPEACEKLLDEFEEVDDDVACLNNVDSKLMAENERVSLLVAASSVCFLKKEM